MASDKTGAAALAQRYAEALFALADEQKLLDTVAEDLRQLGAMIAESSDLRVMLRNPLLQRAAQEAAILALADAAEFSPTTRNFLGLVARKRRLFALDGMVKAFLAELARRRGETLAEVTAARPLSDAQVAAITDVLKTKLGAQVSLDVKTDPAIIGGLIVRVGSKLIDGSVRSKLDRLERAMLAAR